MLERLKRASKPLRDDASGGEKLTDEEIKGHDGQFYVDAEREKYRQVIQGSARLRRSDRRARVGFQHRLMCRWGRAIELYDLFLLTARQMGQDFNHSHRIHAVENKDYVFEVLSRTHARARLITSEIRALIVSGHASGALSRWRSLHELSVIAYFVREHGNDVAERYMLHEVIASAKASDKYERYYQVLGYEPQDPNVRSELLRRRDEMVKRYGVSYKKDYGWAASVLPGNPTFDRIEAAVGLDHWRPRFTMASHSIHASFKGVTSDIGYLDSTNPESLMLAGPSNAGLADPAHCSVLALTNCTLAFLSHSPYPETEVDLQVLLRFADDVGAAFLAADQRLKKDEAVL